MLPLTCRKRCATAHENVHSSYRHFSSPSPQLLPIQFSVSNHSRGSASFANTVAIMLRKLRIQNILLALLFTSFLATCLLLSRMSNPYTNIPPGNSLPLTASPTPLQPPSQRQQALSGSPQTSPISPDPLLRPLNNSIVMAATRKDSVDWVRTELPEWQAMIYAVDDPGAALHTPRNKGKETMAYLTYVIDHYARHRSVARAAGHVSPLAGV